MGADKSNKNPSRVFRLAGGWHVKPDREPVKSEIVGDSGIRYSYSDLRDRLLALFRELSIRRQLEVKQYHQDLLDFSRPTAILSDGCEGATATNATATNATLSGPREEISPRYKYKDITVAVPMEISLICALGKSKEYLNGVVTLRNTSMAALARDLLGVQAEFQRLGQIASDDA
jgi:hypothetical protein